MPGVTYHTLRHSAATILLRMGLSLHEVRDILGHASVKTTERYAHVLIDDQKAGLDKLGKGFLKLVDPEYLGTKKAA
jgi:site-specific recombinase XerD